MFYAVRNRLKYLQTNLGGHGKWRLAFYCHDTEMEEEDLSLAWHRMAYAKLVKLSNLLKNVEHIDGRLTCIDDSSIINDAHHIRHMQTFNSLVRTLIGASSIQNFMKESSSCVKPVNSFFSKQSGRRAMKVDSLTKICNFLGISAQQRKNIRLTVCPQVTQHHIWRGAIEEVLKDVRCEMDNLDFYSPALQMAKQVIVSCLQFLEDASSLQESEAPAWMRPAPLNKVQKLDPPRKWGEVLEMFVHLSRCMGKEERLICDISKVEAMKEGLYQMKDIVIERNILCKDARRQDSLVQKKLTKSLGHSSNCLFTLLMFYLYGTVRDVDVEVCGGVCGGNGKFYLQMGKILTSDDERMVTTGVRQLYRALGLFRYVWETTSMDGVLKLQGHLWSVGVRERSFVYRGCNFYVHDIRL
ncbi:hypothetical protein AXF42_Ash002359 [Apostasia shenzhenica]|uniref:Uncharacterized protein n=1 Tax=Apostasia shenzhenica TaxID=1088818 RepID=A0A2I0ANI2_9ASPA|nr:hypothetical protein AXF42_Ash002359 [Apostasia shenzhenica]